ncbi:MAG: ABC transporter permease [Desulfomonile tiedjei]|nr:ABC transporter permease [Desulfomonile tiedjei]
MIHWNYVFSELSHRWRRTSVNISIIAFSIGVLIVVNVVGSSFQKAFRVPMEDMGATLTIQRAGDVPEKMEGLVLPCSVAPIRQEEVRSISQLAGVQSVSEALLVWDFDKTGFRIIAGLEPYAVSGPSLLKKALVSGRFLEKDDANKVVIDLSFAGKGNPELGQTMDIQGNQFEVVGVVDSSRVSQLAAAQVYLNLPQARQLVADSPQVKAVHTFSPGDSNLLFVQTDRDMVDTIEESIKGLMGDKASVSSPSSFREMLGGVFSLTDRFSGMISILALVAALVLVARTAAGNVQERKADIGTMKSVGWTTKDIIVQIGSETLVVVLIGTILGVLMGIIAAKMLALVTISIPIPWEMSPRPHFMPGGGDQLTRDVQLSVSISPLLLVSAFAGALVIGLTSAWAIARAITRLKPSEVFRYE